MKIVEVNTVDYGSTGRIMLQIAQCARTHGHGVWTYSMAPKVQTVPPEGHKYYSGYLAYCVHYILGKITGCNGFFSLIPTLRLIKDFQKIKPDIVHLHNLHGFSVNLPLLFGYLKKTKVRVIWTLHDCWAFTGHCAHFESIKCEKWKTGCYSCPLYKGYPESNVDNSKWMWGLKRKWFSGLIDLTIVTPSNWLAKQVRESFLKNYPVRVINNGIDLTIFKPTKSEFRKQFGIEEAKHIVLGIAFGWGYKKGLDVFVQLAKSLGEKYQIVLVGTSEDVDQTLPHNIISIHRTSNQRELVAIYSAADVFVNATREDTFPTVNIEALACGIPVITFGTGGSPEILDNTCGMTVPCNDVTLLQAAIERVINEKPFTQSACVNRSAQFDRNGKYTEYVALYQPTIMNGQRGEKK